MAAGALQAIYEARLRVPDDISVVGYDDTLAASLTPRLTTIAQPMTELGMTAIRLALAAIGDPDFAPQTTTLSPRVDHSQLDVDAALSTSFVVRLRTKAERGSGQNSKQPFDCDRQGQKAKRETRS